MASVRLIRRKKQNQDGTHPIAIQIIKDRRPSLITIGNVNASDWDDLKREVKRSHPNHRHLNNYFRKKLAEATDKALEMETKRPEASATGIKNSIKPKAAPTFFFQASLYLEDLKKAGKYNQYTADKPRIGHFKEFLKGREIAFSDLSVGLLKSFVTWLKSDYKPLGKKKDRLSDRSIANHLVTIRSVFAFARDNEVVDGTKSPFGRKGIKITFPETTKVGLALADVIALENCELADPRYEHARKLWLFLFYFAGMRPSDGLRIKWSDFKNDRLYYQMGKNKKTGSLKIPDKAAHILKHYEQFRENKDDLVFPDLKGVDLNNEFKTKRTIAFKISAIDKFLKLYVAPAASIDKTLTLHIARHTFATLAGGSVDIQKLQKLYRHSDVKTTINYQQNFIHQDADDALDAVINKVKMNPTPS